MKNLLALLLALSIWLPSVAFAQQPITTTRLNGKQQSSTPSNPANGYSSIYFDNSGNLKILQSDGSTATVSTGSSGVTSVGLALPNIFTVSNSPVTTTGTLTGTLATQDANLIWAGPTTGAAATPTFRSLVVDDLPGSIPASKLVGTDITATGTITSGTWNGTVIGASYGGTGQSSLQASINALMAASGALSSGDIFYYNGTNVVRLAKGSDNDVLKLASGLPSWAAPSSSVAWSAISNPSGNLSLSHSTNTTTFTWGAASGSNVSLFKLTDGSSTATGQSYILDITAGTSSTITPLRLKRTSASTSTAIVYGIVGGSEYTAAAKYLIGFGYLDSNSTKPSIVLGEMLVGNGSFTYGDLFIGGREAENNNDPTEWARFTYERKFVLNRAGSTSTQLSTVDINQPAYSGISTAAAGTLLRLTGGAHTTLGSTTEFIDVDFNLARTVQHSAGAITNQRAILFRAPTYSFVSSSTITNAATLAIDAAPTAGTNATITNSYALWVQAGTTRVDGGVTVGTTGTKVTAIISNSATLDFGDLATEAHEDLTITVTGAATGDVVELGLPTNAMPTNPGDQCVFQAWVSAADTVTIRATNPSTSINYNPPSGTYRVAVKKF